VVSNQDRMLLKDMYLIPLLESQAVPQELLLTMEDRSELDEALPSGRPSMLLGIIVRHATKSVGGARYVCVCVTSVALNFVKFQPPWKTFSFDSTCVAIATFS